MVEITNIGFSYDSLQRSTENGNKILRGIGTIYSKDNGEEYCDDFEFTYNITKDIMIISPDSSFWEDYYDEIESLLLDNLKANVL